MGEIFPLFWSSLLYNITGKELEEDGVNYHNKKLNNLYFFGVFMLISTNLMH